MNINNNSEITNLIANSISKLNLKPIAKQEETKETQKIQNNEEISFKQEDTALIETSKKTNQIDVADIQKYANLMGEELSLDDINYGLMYGRSVIADYSA